MKPRIGRGGKLLRTVLALGALCFGPVWTGASAAAQTATDLGLGFHFGCAVLTNGSVVCWGSNRWGQLGDGSTIAFSTTPRLVSGIINAVQVEAGNHHACALLSTGEVRCWGYNRYGQVGVYTPGEVEVRDPVPVPLPAAATAIGAGALHSCALLVDGRVFCWAVDSRVGQLGDGQLIVADWRAEERIVQVSGITTATQLSVDVSHSCAVLTDGTTMCWGENTYSQLGVPAAAVEDCGGTPCSTTPVTVPGVSAGTVAAGGSHTCAIQPDQTAWCWGGSTGSGSGSTSGVLPPTQVSGPVAAAQIAAGGGHSCAIALDGQVQCWGDASNGQIGDQASAGWTVSATPVAVPSLNGSAVSLSAGNFHTCAIRTDGSVSCFGSNTFGELGNGTTVDSAVPVTVVDPGTIQSLSIVPSSATVSSGESQAFQGWGGTPPYTFSFLTNSSGATLDSSTGAYVAGATGSVTDWVRVMDQGGRVADATVNVTPPPVDADADGLDDAFESGFGGAGVTIFSPSASPPHSGSSTGDAYSGATISTGEMTVVLPPGTTAESPTTEIGIRYRDNSPGPGLDPSVEVSGVVLPSGETKSIEIPFGDRDAVCIDDSPTATLESLDAMSGGCRPPAVQIDVPDQVGYINASGSYAVTRVSVATIRVDGLTHTAMIAVPARSIAIWRRWWFGWLVAVLVTGISIVTRLRFKESRRSGRSSSG